MQKLGQQIILSATDLANHLACQYLTDLNRKVAEGQLEKPYRDDPILETIIERGNEHEAAYVEHLRRKDGSLVEIERWDAEARPKTLAAMTYWPKSSSSWMLCLISCPSNLAKMKSQP